MDNFSFCAPTRYLFGRDTEKETGSMAANEMGAKNAMLVYGGGSAVRSGLLSRVQQSLDHAGIAHIEFGGIKPNPTDDRVYEGIALAREKGVDGLLAVGGGSVIDTAKAIAAGVPYDGDFWDFYAGKAIVEEALPVGVVLTIPAAGSEGSGNSVITKLDGLKKISLRTDKALRPKFAIMNPVLTMTLPAYQTAAGIADMMAHILERYFSPTAEVDVTDRISEGLLMAIMEEGRKVMKNPQDYQARANIMWAGTMAHNGICGCGRVEDWSSHFMEHEISAIYGVTHGAGLAVVFPAWIAYMASVKPEKPAQLARRVLGVKNADDRAAALEGAARLKSFFAEISLPTTFAGLGVDNPDIPLLVEHLHSNKGELIGNYSKLDSEATTEIYKLMLI